jgi:hypothetical protein
VTLGKPAQNSQWLYEITSHRSRLAVSNQLKKLYRNISHPETNLLIDSGEAQDEDHIINKGGPSKTRCENLIDNHKWYAPFVFLSDLYHLNSFS